jgi:hypothetical protein
VIAKKNSAKKKSGASTSAGSRSAGSIGSVASAHRRVGRLAPLDGASRARVKQKKVVNAGRRCRFDGGCCRADPVAAPASAPSGTDQQKKDQQKKEPPPHHHRPRYRDHPAGLDIAAPASAPSGTHQQKKDQQKKEFAARVSLGAASAARSAGELVLPPSLARARNRSEMVNAAPL